MKLLQAIVKKQVDFLLLVNFYRTIITTPKPVTPVGASLLAMDVNENTGCLIPIGARTTIASMLAPTGASLSGVAAPCRHPPSRTCSNPCRSVASA
ncbi:hypothetical protein DKY63_02600 [Pseudomonas putida]|uniref:Uncharacterized protein n=1 Tax=Pseudomonas putida TaxID=303 RepID=A0A2Z4RCP0_PSEPU|nr:hypothetical protein DKY63_02600 [Pseudomonas putida]